MNMVLEMIEEQHEAELSQVRVELAVVQAGLNHAVNTLKAILKIPAGKTSSCYTIAAQALKEIDAITIKLNESKLLPTDSGGEPHAESK